MSAIRRLLLIVTFVLGFNCFFTTNVNASEEYFRGRVIEKNQDSVKVRILNGELEGKVVETFSQNDSPVMKKILNNKGNEDVVITKLDDLYFISDFFRLDKVAYVIGVFFLGVIMLAKFRGLGSIFGMIVSLLVITGFIVPRIIDGKDALTTTIIGAVFIMTTTIYLAHGISSRTTIALISTLGVLLGVGIFASGAVNLIGLTGLGSEEAYTLFYGLGAGVNFKGLLLGGIIIGAMGVLDDVTTSLAATVFELRKANPKWSGQQLFESAMNVGREHITSLVNTLVLAYAGAALPIFIYLVANPSDFPLWQILNTEILAEEIVRTISGSMGLILAVPLTALISVWYVKNKDLFTIGTKAKKLK